MAGHYNLSKVAFSGDYSDLLNAPTMSFVNAEEYGFSSSNSASENESALLSAISACPDGGEVRINQSDDFLCGRTSITNKSIFINMAGAGNWLTPSGGCLVFQNPYINIQDISAIDNVVESIEGSPARVMRLEVTDPTVFNKDDIVRIVSEEQDPWNTRSGRKKGESAVVYKTDSTYVYLSGILEDDYDLGSNPRIGVMPKNRLKANLKVKSDYTNTDVIIQLEAAYKPEINLVIDQHSDIVINNKGSYLGRFNIVGRGKGTSSGNLSYLLNDSSGTGNVVEYAEGHYYRHIVTTNSDAPSAVSPDLQDYGPTRDLYVKEGYSIGSLGVPFDDHAGARRTVFANCKDTYPMRSSATSDASFQLRGRDASIINPVAPNPSQTSNGYSLLKTSEGTSGTIDVINPRMLDAVFNATLVNGDSSPVYGIPTVNVVGGYIRMDDAQTSMQVSNIRIILNGTVLENAGVTRNSIQMFDVQNGGTLILNDPLIIANAAPSTSPTGARVFRVNNGSKLIGNCRLETSGITFSNGVRSEGTTPVVSLKMLSLGGTSDLSQTGTFELIDYNCMSISDPTLNTGTVRPPRFNAATNGFNVVGLPTSSSGLSSGDFWNDGGVVKVVT